MAWQPDYCTTAELKTYLTKTSSTDDTLLGAAIAAASRAIDQRCNRQFGLTGSAVARFYAYKGVVIEGRAALEVDDLQTTTGLAVAVDLNEDGVYEQSLTNGSDYDLWPWNAAAEGKPWTHLVMRPTAVSGLPCAARGIQVTGNWGWTTVPSLVKLACEIQAHRYFARRDSPYGVAGSPEFGNELRLLAKLDPDVHAMLISVTRVWGAA